MGLKLHYFDVPGRAEAARIILAIGKIPFEDVFVARDTWSVVKPTTPMGQLPFLELEDGRKLAQSGAINRYLANLAGIYPTDPLAAALADSASFLATEMGNVLGPTQFIPDADEKLKVRQGLMAGVVKDKLLMLSKMLDASPFLSGKELSFADVEAFCLLSFCRSGVMAGIPDLLDEYPTLKAFHTRVANVEAIKAKYANATGLRVGWQPSA